MYTKQSKILGLLACTLIFALGACAPAAAPATPTAQPKSEIANPASVYCNDHGGKLQIVTATDGSQSGMCTLPDGTQCDEWSYFRGECGPGTKTASQGIPPAPGKNDPAAADQAGKQAAQKLAADLKIDPSTISVQSTELVTWPDACLGLAVKDEMCAAVETPGFRVLLVVGSQRYTYRTDYAGKVIRAEAAASGG